MRQVSKDAIKALERFDFARFDYLTKDSARRYSKRFTNWRYKMAIVFKFAKSLRKQARKTLELSEPEVTSPVYPSPRRNVA